ncbi:hypothetical protein FPV67DRAFT_1357930, partial [Lyophyllum atratum]
ASTPFVVYLKEYWMPKKYRFMWSAIFRTNRTIWEMSDTHMLVEAWHHILKGKFLQGRRNRCVDLIYLLINRVLPHYALKEQHQ